MCCQQVVGGMGLYITRYAVVRSDGWGGCVAGYIGRLCDVEVSIVLYAGRGVWRSAGPVECAGSIGRCVAGELTFAGCCCRRIMASGDVSQAGGGR